MKLTMRASLEPNYADGLDGLTQTHKMTVEFQDDKGNMCSSGYMMVDEMMDMQYMPLLLEQFTRQFNRYFEDKAKEISDKLEAEEFKNEDRDC